MLKPGDTRLEIMVRLPALPQLLAHGIALVLGEAREALGFIEHLFDLVERHILNLLSATLERKLLSCIAIKPIDVLDADRGVSREHVLGERTAQDGHVVLRPLPTDIRSGKEPMVEAIPQNAKVRVRGVHANGSPVAS